MQEVQITSSFGAMGSVYQKLRALLVHPEQQKEGGFELLNHLEEIQSFLTKLSRVEAPNMMVKHWTNQVRDLSYDIDDYIDTKLYSNTSYGEASPEVEEFSSLVKQASDACKRHRRYNLGRWAEDSCLMDDRQGHLPKPKKENTNLIGIDEYKAKLIEQLNNDAEQQLKVVSILGPRGVGKTALANQVYHQIGGRFECRAFVRASMMPDTRMLLRSIVSQVQLHPQPAYADTVQDLIDKLRKHLHDKRYLIVIDGLWETTSWDIVKSAFPHGTDCSIIIITTDISEVALESCDDQSHCIINMKPLSRDDSMILFYNTVFDSKDECSDKLIEGWEDVIEECCGGMPLAIISIAGIMARQPDNLELWNRMKARLSSSILPRGEMLREILCLSYSNLSIHLKTCLLYLTIYPEGYKLFKADIVKQWTAEGFVSTIEEKVTSDGTKRSLTENEVAECYFDELVHRGFIQPIYANYSYEVMFYTVHSTVYEVIKHMSIEENFTTEIDCSDTITDLSAKVRRLSLNFSNARYATKPEGITLSAVRSLNFCGLVECLPSIMDFKVLRVLILELWGDDDKELNLTGIDRSFLLKYVQITTDIDVKLPAKMSGLQYLETLEIHARNATIPSDIIHLPKLAHLNIQCEIRLPDFVDRMRSLRTLQSFDLGRNSEDNVRGLGEMANLHDLHLTCSSERSDHLKNNLMVLVSSLGKNETLKSLVLAPGASCTSIYLDCSRSVSSLPIFLQRLELLPPICIFSRLPECIGLLRKLRVLKIEIRELTRDDIERVAMLLELTVLSLYVRQPTAESIIFNSSTFPVLKYLKFRCGILRLAFQAEAMPNLLWLKLVFNAHRGEQYADMVTGIEHLINLQGITVRIGAAPGAEESDRTTAECAFKETIYRHSRSPIFSIGRVNSIMEEIPQFPDPHGTSPRSCMLTPLVPQSAELLNMCNRGRVTSEPDEIIAVEEVSTYSSNMVPHDPLIPVNKVVRSLPLRTANVDAISASGSCLQPVYIYLGSAGMLNAVARQVAAFLRIKANWGDLDKARESLRSVESTVRARVAAEEDKLNICDPQVQGWLSRVDELLLDTINEDYISLLRFSSLSQCTVHARRRAWIGKRVVKAIQEVNSLAEEGKRFKKFGKPPSEIVNRLPQIETFGLESMLARLHDLLENGDSNIIGVWGQGGIGKTTLLHVFNNDLEKRTHDYQVVIFIEISNSETLNAVEIQKTISERLNLPWNESETVELRARFLVKALARKKFVALLDDVRKKFWLEDVGIPTPDTNSRSKLILTSRYQEICFQMGAQKRSIEMQVLDNNAAWKLFLSKLGNEACAAIESMGPNDVVRKHAMAIVKSCKGLPLVLNVIGTAVAALTEPREWKLAASTLNKTNTKSTDGVDEMFYRLKYSYGRLTYTQQQCFLYCTLFPEYGSISKEQLVDYWFAEGLLLNDSRRGYQIIHNLISACLLQTSSSISSKVKMHHVIRHLGLWLVNKTDKKFLVQAGMALGSAPAAEEWKEATRISIMSNDIKEISFSPKCRSLTTLLIQNNPNLSRLSLGFFKFMPSLKVLDLSHTAITSLPECETLVSLQHLNLSHTLIRRLPERLWLLKDLMHLDLSVTVALEDTLNNCSKLLKLRVLNLFRSHYGIHDVDDLNLDSLKALMFLGITIYAEDVLKKLNKTSPLAKSTYRLNLKFCHEMQSIKISDLNHLVHLEELYVESCYELNTLVADAKQTTSGLEHLTLAVLHSLENVIVAPVPHHFQHIRKLVISMCHKLQNITWVLKLEMLERLVVSHCDGMLKIVDEDDSDEEQTMPVNPSKQFEDTADERSSYSNIMWKSGSFNGKMHTGFSNLRSIVLTDVKKLRCICKPRDFPSLETIRVEDCPDLRSIPLSSRYNCGKLKQVCGSVEWWKKLEWEEEEAMESKFFIPI